MLIGIDVSRTAETKTGLGSYARSLLAAMARIDQQNEYLLFPFVRDCFPPNYDRAFCPDQGNFRLNRRGFPKALMRLLWKVPAIDRYRLITGDPDVYFSPFHSVPRRLYHRLVCVFHDVSFRVHPEFSEEFNVRHCEENFEYATRFADRMITVSNFSKQEMVDKMGVPADWISVTHEAADPMFQRIEGCRLPERIRRAIGEPEQTLLYVGSVEPRKNIATLIRAFGDLVERGRCNPTLIVAGGSGWKNSQVYAEVDRRGLIDRVHFTGFVSDEELVQLYNAATAFVFPTIYEGFGLPVIEAMSCGAPVVTSRVTSIPEVGGDAVAYIDDPHDEVALRERIEEVLTSPELRSDLIERGLEQAAKFTWERTARETLAVLENVYENPEYRRTGVEMGRDERGLDRGWHGLEHADGRAFRWSDRAASLRLEPRADASEPELQIDAASNLPAGEQTLLVYVGDHLCGHAALSNEWATYRFATGALPKARATEITLRVSIPMPRIWGDPRTLGARVARVSF